MSQATKVVLAQQSFQVDFSCAKNNRPTRSTPGPYVGFKKIVVAFSWYDQMRACCFLLVSYIFPPSALSFRVLPAEVLTRNGVPGAQYVFTLSRSFLEDEEEDVLDPSSGSAASPLRRTNRSGVLLAHIPIVAAPPARTAGTGEVCLEKGSANSCRAVSEQAESSTGGGRTTISDVVLGSLPPSFPETNLWQYHDVVAGELRNGTAVGRGPFRGLDASVGRARPSVGPPHTPRNKPPRFILEIGSNSRNLVQEESQPFILGRSMFLLSFEPLLDKYAHLLRRFAPHTPPTSPARDFARTYGFQHPRGMAFPFAVGCNRPRAVEDRFPSNSTASPRGSAANNSASTDAASTDAFTDNFGGRVLPTRSHALFRVSQIDGCSSLLRPTTTLTTDSLPEAERQRGHWPELLERGCLRTRDVRVVPCVDLDEILREWTYEGEQIYELKVDAQGFDIEVVRSAGVENLQRRVARIQLETRADSTPAMYDSADGGVASGRCSDVVAEMAGMGFRCWPGCAADGANGEDGLGATIEVDLTCENERFASGAGVVEGAGIISEEVGKLGVEPSASGVPETALLQVFSDWPLERFFERVARTPQTPLIVELGAARRDLDFPVLIPPAPNQHTEPADSSHYTTVPVNNILDGGAALLLSLEPNLHRYAGRLLNHGGIGDEFAPLGQQHPRALVLPFDVSCPAAEGRFGTAVSNRYACVESFHTLATTWIEAAREIVHVRVDFKRFGWRWLGDGVLCGGAWRRTGGGSAAGTSMLQRVWSVALTGVSCDWAGAAVDVREPPCAPSAKCSDVWNFFTRELGYDVAMGGKSIAHVCNTHCGVETALQFYRKI